MESGWLSTYFGKLKTDGKPEDGDCHLGWDSDNEYVLRSMMWADNYWLFCHNRDFLVPYGERYHRRTVELGHGTQAGITMVDERTRGGGQAHAQGGRKRERLGLAVQGGLRCAGV